jgi:hypothetical protein
LVLALVAIDHQIVVIKVQVGKKLIEVVFLNGGSRMNIIMKKLRMQLGLSKPKPAPYNLHMHYKKSRFLLLGILVKKTPIWFFAPMSNLTKVPFWISQFGPDCFD